MSNFFGVNKQTDKPMINGTEISMGSPITEETINRAAKLILDAHMRPYCQDAEGAFHHFPFPFAPKVCQLCGWSI